MTSDIPDAAGEPATRGGRKRPHGPVFDRHQVPFTPLTPEQAMKAFRERDPLFKPLTIDEAAEVAGRTRRTIDQWIKDGHLRVVPLGDPPRRAVVKKELLELEARKWHAGLRGRPPRSATEPDPGGPS